MKQIRLTAEDQSLDTSITTCASSTAKLSPRDNLHVHNSSRLYLCEMFKLHQVGDPPLHRGPQDLVPVLHVAHVQLLQH